MFHRYNAHPRRYRVAAAAALVIGLTVVGTACGQDHPGEGVRPSTGFAPAVRLTAPFRRVTPALPSSALVRAPTSAPVAPRQQDDTARYGSVMDNQFHDFENQVFGHN